MWVLIYVHRIFITLYFHCYRIQTVELSLFQLHLLSAVHNECTKQCLFIENVWEMYVYSKLTPWFNYFSTVFINFWHLVFRKNVSIVSRGKSDASVLRSDYFELNCFELQDGKKKKKPQQNNNNPGFNQFTIRYTFKSMSDTFKHIMVSQLTNWLTIRAKWSTIDFGFTDMNERSHVPSFVLNAPVI